MSRNELFEISVDFTHKSATSNVDTRISPENAASNPMARLFIGNSRKFDAMMDCFERLCSLGGEVRVEHEPSEDFFAVASASGNKGMIILMNAGDCNIPLALNCHGMSPAHWQIIDACRTNTAIPPLAAIPPASIVSIECLAGT